MIYSIKQKLLCFLLLVNFFFLFISSENLHISREYSKLSPHTGLMLWPEHSSEYDSAITLEFSYCLPSDYVLGKDSSGNIKYNWTGFDYLLNTIASRNHSSVIRFRYVYPGYNTTAVPLYIKALSDYHETTYYNADEGYTIPYPDWTNSELQWFTIQFMKDFAQRYDKSPLLAYMQLGFGHWAEYHIYGTPLQEGVNFPSKEYQTKYIQSIEFIDTPYSFSIDIIDPVYSPVLDAYNGELNTNFTFGCFDDTFMDSAHEIVSGDSNDGWNEREWIELLAFDAYYPRWHTQPSGGEISYENNAYDQHHFLSTQGVNGHTWEEAAKKYHITYMSANDATISPGESGYIERLNRFKAAGMYSGYTFSIVDINAIETDETDIDSTTFEHLDDENQAVYTVIVNITNIGIAPPYHQWYLSINNQTNNCSLIHLLPGEYEILTFYHIILPRNLTQLDTSESSEEFVISFSSPKLVPSREVPFATGKVLNDTNTSNVSSACMNNCSQSSIMLSFICLLAFYFICF